MCVEDLHQGGALARPGNRACCGSAVTVPADVPVLSGVRMPGPHAMVNEKIPVSNRICQDESSKKKSSYRLDYINFCVLQALVRKGPWSVKACGLTSSSAPRQRSRAEGAPPRPPGRARFPRPRPDARCSSAPSRTNRASRLHLASPGLSVQPPRGCEVVSHPASW